MTDRGFTRTPNAAYEFGPNGPCWVYRHVAADGATLYIGCTSQPESRQPAHRRMSPWFGLVVEIIYHGPMTEDEAVALERRLIQAEDPPFNVQCTSRGRGPLPPARTVDPDAWIVEQEAATARGGDAA